MLSHTFKKMKRVVPFSPRHRSFVHNNKALAGVTDLLRMAYYPGYVKAKPTAEGRRKAPTGGPSVHHTVFGVTRGAVVDRQLCAAAEGKPFKRPHPWTSYVLSALRRKDLTLVAGQVPCVDLEARIGTAADLVCVDNANRLVVVEIKCGFARGAHEATNGTRLRHPFGDYTDCPKNQHFLQLAATLSLFESTYCRRARGALVRVDDAGVSISWLPDDFALRAGDVRSALTAAASARRRERSEARASGEHTKAATGRARAPPRKRPKASGSRPRAGGRSKRAGPPRAPVRRGRVAKKPVARRAPKPLGGSSRRPKLVKA